MLINQLSLPIAFLAGLLSFFSPCVFALVPSYIGVLSGHALQSDATSAGKRRWHTFWHGVAFVLGFSTVFMIGGFAFTALAGLLFDYSNWLTWLGGIVVIFFGLHTLGIINLPFLDYEAKLEVDTTHAGINYVSSFLMGIGFAAGWSPCVGPIFGAILTAAAQNSSLAFPMLLAYTLGLAAPFLVAALAMESVGSWMRKMGKWRQTIKWVSGVLLLLIGILLLTGRIGIFASSFAAQPWAVSFQEWIDNLLLGLGK